MFGVQFSFEAVAQLLLVVVADAFVVADDVVVGIVVNTIVDPV